MVYHYSDGSLEYEEHFNASNALQEVLKYFYDADGNVEYLLYKDGNFSTATSYDLYYYVRNATGDITDLFQTREQSGTGTLEVNRLAAHYEYDPYGNILSVDKYNNDPIGDINPIRYKDYYYDAQTGWYQLGSRFYDPEVGRFLNADDVSLLMETDSGVVDKNLYAYCDGNPVMRKDEGGDFWNIVIGAALGAAIDVGYQVLIEKKSLDKVNWVDVGAAAVSGGFAASGFGVVGQTVANGVISGVAGYIKGERGMNLAVTAGLGALSGRIGGKGANYKGAITDIKNYAKAKLAREGRRVNIKYAAKVTRRIRNYRAGNYWKIGIIAAGRGIAGYLTSKAGSASYNYAKN